MADDSLFPPMRQQVHGRARSAPDTASLTSFNQDDKAGQSDRIDDHEKFFVEHDGIFWYDAGDVTTSNANRVDAGAFSGNFVREIFGKIHSMTTAERTDAEFYSLPSGQSAICYDSTEVEYYRADGNGLLVSPTFTLIPTGGGGGPDGNFADTDSGNTLLTARSHDLNSGLLTFNNLENFNLNWGATGDLRFNNDPGTLNYVAKSNGTGLPPTWVDVTSLIDVDLFETTFTLTGDSGTPQLIEDDDTMTIAGGEGIATIVSATDTLTIDMEINELPTNGSLTGNESIALYNPTTALHEQILITNLPGGGGPDTHFFNDDLTADASYSHELGAFSTDIASGAVIRFQLDGGTNTSIIGVAGSDFSANDDGLQLNVGTGNDLKVDGLAGLEGQVIVSHGPLTPPTWQFLPLEIQEDGAQIEPQAKKLNFKGAGVSLLSTAANEVEITIPGGGGGAALSTEDEGVSVETDTQVIDFVGQKIRATSTAANEIEVNTDNFIEYGENLTAGNFVKIGPDGKAYKLFSTPVQQIDSITTTDWESIVSGSVEDSGNFQRISRIDDNRVLIAYRDPATTGFLTVADRSGTTSYSTLGTPVDPAGFNIATATAYQSSTGHVLATGNNTGLNVFSLSGVTLTAVGSATFTNKSASGEKGGGLHLMEGETKKWFHVWQRGDGHIWGAIIDATTPTAPTIGTEVDFGDRGASTDFYMDMQRINVNQFLLQWTDGSNICRAMVVTADPGGSHTAGATYTLPSSTSSNQRDALVVLSDSRAVIHFRTGTAGIDDKLQLVQISGSTITSLGSSYDLTITDNGNKPYMQRISDTQFVLATCSAGVVRATIFNLVSDAFVQIATTSAGSKEVDADRQGPVGAWQGGTSFAYLTGDNNGLHFVKTTIASLITDLEKVAGTAGQTLSAGATGIIRYHGEISENQSGLATGEVYYLTTAGSLTTLNTGYKVGIAKSPTSLLLDFDTVIANALQVGYGSISVEDNATTRTFSGSSTDFSNKVQIVSFDTNGSMSSNTTPDHTEDHVIVLTSGNWEVSYDLSVVGNSGDTLSCAIYVNNGTSKKGARCTRTITGASQAVGFSGTRNLYNLNAGDTIEIWIQNETGTTAATIQDASLTVRKM